MKKLSKILILLLIPFSFFVTNNTFAGDKISVTVTEYIPGAGCECKGGEKDGKCDSGVYECKVEKGFTPVVSMMGNIIKYFTYIAGLGAVLFIVVNGILYSMSGMDDSMKTDAKNRIVKTLSGLIVLLLSGIILNLIAPWIYK